MEHTNTIDSNCRKNTQLDSLDMMKFICMFLVIAIHVPPFENLSEKLDFLVEQCVCRVAVPMYFITSGYLLFRKIDIRKIKLQGNVIKKYLIRILQLYCIWSLFYLPVSIDFSKGLVYAFLRWMLCFIFQGITHLWYFNALIVAVIFCSMFLYFTKGNIKYLLTTGGVLYIVGLLAQSYYAILSPLLENRVILFLFNTYLKIFGTTRNGIFEGVLFVGIGAFFSQKKYNKEKNKCKLYFLMFSFLFLIEVIIVNRFSLNRANDMYIFLVPTTFFLFCLVIQAKIKAQLPYSKIRNVGTLMYCSHIYFRKLYDYLLCVICVQKFPLMSMSVMRYIMVVVFSASFAVMVIMLQRKLKFLKYLY